MRFLVGAAVFAILSVGASGGWLSPAGSESIGGVVSAQSDAGWNLDPREPLDAAQRAWVEDTLERMSTEQRVGQILMVRAFGEYYPADAEARLDLQNMVRDLALGGVIMFRSEVFEAAALVNDLQAVAADAGSVPLIVAADFEWGADFRINGAVASPTAMAVGATYDLEAAEWMGRAAARDARALGIHWIFAPVADVNVNPNNPVINVRAFGEDPAAVGRMAAAFVRGAQALGVLATAKHFPGHGDTGVDSHISLPVLEHGGDRLRAVELVPFRDAISAGVASVMTAHLAVPALTGDPSLPATLSHAVLTELLRDELGFEGLVVTDAMEMGGITERWWGGEAAVQAVVAGSDMVLLPPRTRAIHAALVRAVEYGTLPRERLDAAVRAVLEAKARLGLTDQAARASLATLPERFAPAADAAQAQRVADDAVTLLRDRDGLLPLDARRWQNVVVVGISDNDAPVPAGDLASALRESLGGVATYSIDGRTRGDDAAEIVAEAAKARIVVLAVRVRVRTSSGRIRLPDRQARYAAMLGRLEVPTIVVALGSPYAVAAFPAASTALTTYGWSTPLQRAAARAITGAIGTRGRLPVSVPGAYALGHGVTRPPLDATLAELTPATARTAADDASVPDLAPARAVLADWAERGAFPGASYAVGYRNEIIAQGAVGRMSSASDAPPMRGDAIFDLASLTKVVATTPVAMRAIERGDLRLDYPVRSLVPEFSGPGRDAVTVRHLLTHTSGLPAYVEFFREFDPATVGPRSRARVLDRIFSTELEAAPGTRYAYSDLGIILLGEVLTRALGEPYWEFAAREIYAPLGMDETGWNPPVALRDRIAPTEVDSWRGRLLQGEVHDENAYSMGGISSHAGLFSTARDLAVYAQMLLNLGTYDHQRILQRWTVAPWTRRAGVLPDSSRALGWDTAWESSRWGMFDPAAYGHTGFTGTSLWIDPSRELFVVLLTNRVNPTRDNTRHVQARIDFHAEVVRAIDRASSTR